MSGRLHPRVAVIGAGANGLASALAMQKRGFHVTIIAEKFSPRTTSDGAGGECGGGACDVWAGGGRWGCR